MPKASPTSRVLWCFRAFGAVCDRQIENVLNDLPPSTVRGVRKKLERSAVIRRAGYTRDKRRRFELVPPEPPNRNQPANQGRP